MSATAAGLYAKHSQSELLALQQQLCDDPASKAKSGLILYTQPVCKRLRLIEAAIAMHMTDKRAAQGNRVPTCGYSGRQSNRR